jgi:hypothetical protein
MSKFIQIGKTNLECYPDGTILRQNVRSKKWKICKSSKTKIYLIMKIDDKWYLMHRVIAHAFGILDLHDELMIDHIDLNKKNNCIENLRPATRQQNSFNTTYAKGYSWNINRNKWTAQIMVSNKSIFLGYFDTEEDARQAYLDAKDIYHKF